MEKLLWRIYLPISFLQHVVYICKIHTRVWRHSICCYLPQKNTKCPDIRLDIENTKNNLITFTMNCAPFSFYYMIIFLINKFLISTNSSQQQKRSITIITIIKSDKNERLLFKSKYCI